MEEMTKEKEIEALEKEIEALPVGYISKKNIHGKIRYYRQWTESGKIKSQYIKEEELEELCNLFNCNTQDIVEFKKKKK